MKYQKWSVWRADLDPVIGSEQGKTRPVMIISEGDINEILNVVNILPITTKKPGRSIYPNETLLTTESGGLKHESIVLCHQIRTIDKRRLSKKYGQITDLYLQIRIIEAIKFQLGIS